VRLELLQALTPIACLADLIACTAEKLPVHGPERRFVINQQNAAHRSCLPSLEGHESFGLAQGERITIPTAKPEDEQRIS